MLAKHEELYKQVWLAFTVKPVLSRSGIKGKTYAIDSVAEPFPAFASTTSVPPSWVLLVSALITSSGKLACGEAC